MEFDSKSQHHLHWKNQQRGRLVLLVRLKIVRMNLENDLQETVWQDYSKQKLMSKEDLTFFCP